MVAAALYHHFMSYSRVADHRRMLFDGHRNAAYRRAIEECVGPDSIVMDLGAGLGIHGLLAAAAGARRVYLVEPEPVVHAALEAARASGLSDRITIVRERIEDARLPEKVDVIVSAFTGNLLFSEDLLPSLLYARDHHLKAGGRMIPDRAQLWMAPLEAAVLHEEQVGQWQRPVMGMDYSFAASCAANTIVWPSADELRPTRRLSTGTCVADVPLSTATTADCSARAQFTIEETGVCHGLLGWTQIHLHDSWLSTSPEAQAVHWSQGLLPLQPPLTVTRGDVVEVTLSRPMFGEWTWAVSAPGGNRRHSTFFSQAEGLLEFARIAPATAPGLSARGRRAEAILQMLGQSLSNEVVAAQVAQAYGLDTAQALLEVQALARRYGAPS